MRPLLNSQQLYGKVAPGAPKVATQFLIMAFEISSFFDLTNVVALKLGAWSQQITFKSNAITSLKSHNK